MQKRRRRPQGPFLFLQKSSPTVVAGWCAHFSCFSSEAKGSVLSGPGWGGRGTLLTEGHFYVLSVLRPPPERSPSGGCENTPGVVGLLVIVQTSADVAPNGHPCSHTRGGGEYHPHFSRAQKGHERRWELPTEMLPLGSWRPVPLVWGMREAG